MADRKDAIVVTAVALLAIVGIGLLAATIDSTYAAALPGVDPGDGIPGDNGPGDDGMTGDAPDDSAVAPGGGEQSPLEIPEWCVPFLASWQGGLVLALGVVGLTALSFVKFGFVISAFVGYLLGIPTIVGYGLLTQCPPRGDPEGDAQSPLVEFISETAASGGLVATQLPDELLIAILGAALLVGVAALYVASGSEEIVPPEVVDDEEADLAAFAAAAGRAADRIEATDADVDNAVYQAWTQMTSLLALPDHDTTTPAEFAGAAVDRGLDEADVTQLTTLFQEVRYGRLDPEPREEMAVQTLRQIERQYGGRSTEQEEDHE